MFKIEFYDLPLKDLTSIREIDSDTTHVCYGEPIYWLENKRSRDFCGEYPLRIRCLGDPKDEEI